MTFDPVRIGIVSISDRASTGVYEDKGLPALQDWLSRALKNPIEFVPRLIPDERDRISETLIELAGFCTDSAAAASQPPKSGRASSFDESAALMLNCGRCLPWSFPSR